MSQFGRAFEESATNPKLSHEELVRVIRYMITAEYGAVQLYQEMAGRANNTLAQKTLADIASEEKEHAEELIHLLRQLAPEESYQVDGESTE